MRLRSSIGSAGLRCSRTDLTTRASISAAGTRRTDPALSAAAVQQCGRQIVSVFDVPLAGVARAHAIAAVIEDAAGQQSLGLRSG